MPRIEFYKYSFKEPSQISIEKYREIRQDIQTGVHWSIKPKVSFLKEFPFTAFTFLGCVLVLGYCIYANDYNWIAIVAFLSISSLLSLPSVLSFYNDLNNFYRKRSNDLKTSVNYSDYLLLQSGDRTLKKEECIDFSETYSKMETEELVRLYTQHDSLLPSVVSLLELELNKRSIIIPEKEKEDYTNVQIDDLQKLVADRIAAGEAFEDVYEDLKSKGANPFLSFYNQT